MAASTLTTLVADLSTLAKYYVEPTGHDAASLAPKMALINLSRKIMYTLMDPGMLNQAHSLQMAELVSIRTLLDQKVFEKLPGPEEGKTILAKELAEESGVQQALLGRTNFNSPIDERIKPFWDAFLSGQIQGEPRKGPLNKMKNG